MTFIEKYIEETDLEPVDISVLRSNRVLFNAYFHWRVDYESWIPLKGVSSVDMVDELVEVKTDQGNIEKAYHTFYTFKIENGQVVQCDKFWDGGFLREFSNGTITHYRKIKQ